MTAASRSLATALWRARFASGLLRRCYTTNRDTTFRCRRSLCPKCPEERCVGPNCALRIEARIVSPQARIDQPVDKRRASHPLPQAAFKLASFLRQPRLPHAFENRLKLGQKPLIFAPRRPSGPGAGDGEGRVEREAGIDCRSASSSRPSCAKAAAHRKILMRIISVGLDRPSKPRDRLLPKAEEDSSRCPRDHPGIGHRIARTEPEGLDDVSLGFFGATDKDFTKSNRGMGGGKISIQLRIHAHTRRCPPQRAWSLCRQIPGTDGRAHGPGPRTRLWPTSLRPPRRPPSDR